MSVLVGTKIRSIIIELVVSDLSIILSKWLLTWIWVRKHIFIIFRVIALGGEIRNLKVIAIVISKLKSLI